MFSETGNALDKCRYAPFTIIWLQILLLFFFFIVNEYVQIYCVQLWRWSSNRLIQDQRPLRYMEFQLCFTTIPKSDGS